MAVKKISYIIITLFLFVFIQGCKSKAFEKYEDVSTPSFTLPKVEKRILANGLKLFLLEDKSLPIINIDVTIRTGSIYDPKDQLGTAALAGNLLRTGGTKNYTAEELDEKLDFLAINIGSGISRDKGDVSLKTLTKHLDEALKILTEILFEPRFSQDKIDISKEKYIDELKRDNDKPSNIASYKFREMLYGAASPWGRRPSAKSIMSITRKELVEFHKRFFYPNRMIIAISGDFDAELIANKIAVLTQSYKETNAPLPDLKTEEPQRNPNVFFVNKRKMSQTTVNVGHIGINRHNPDKFTLMVFNNILGGSGFWSRLMTKVRREAGLAYSVGSIIDRNEELGLFKIVFNTNSDQVIDAATLVKKELEKILTEGITKKELKIVKESFINSLVMNYRDSESVVDMRATIDYLGYPEDYIDQMLKAVIDLDVKTVNEVAKKYIHPDNLVYVFVGDSVKFKDRLTEFGKVTELNLNN